VLVFAVLDVAALLAFWFLAPAKWGRSTVFQTGSRPTCHQPHNPIVSRLAKSMPTLAAYLVLSGCGGDGGGVETQEGVTDPAPKTVIDTTLDKIALVETAAARKTAYGHVSGVFAR
jgi:hypothetical protein